MFDWESFVLGICVLLYVAVPAAICVAVDVFYRFKKKAYDKKQESNTEIKSIENFILVVLTIAMIISRLMLFIIIGIVGFIFVICLMSYIIDYPFVTVLCVVIPLVIIIYIGKIYRRRKQEYTANSDVDKEKELRMAYVMPGVIFYLLTTMLFLAILVMLSTFTGALMYM